MFCCPSGRKLPNLLWKREVFHHGRGNVPSAENIIFYLICQVPCGSRWWCGERFASYIFDRDGKTDCSTEKLICIINVKILCWKMNALTGGMYPCLILNLGKWVSLICQHPFQVCPPNCTGRCKVIFVPTAANDHRCSTLELTFIKSLDNQNLQPLDGAPARDTQAGCSFLEDILM